MNLDFNSSDFEDIVELEPDRSKVFKPKASIGQRVAEAIINNQATDRPLSKYNYRDLSVGAGAPSTRVHLRLAEVIWDAFCASINHDPSVCPSGEQIFRAIDSRTRRTVPSLRGKTAPSLSTIMGFWRRLIEVLTFRHRDLKQHYGAFEVTRIKTHLDNLVYRKLLVRGKWRKMQWVGFQVLLRIANSWIEHALNGGCHDWDVVLLKLLGLILMGACGARAGDVARSNHYNGVEYLCWADLEMKLKSTSPQEAPSVQDLTLTVTLEYTKGHKRTMNESRSVYIEPLEDPNHSAVCLVKLLLIVALRLGQVQFSTIHEVLAQAAARWDGAVQWKDPKAPVVCKLRPKRDFSKPASTDQLRATVKAMALNAGVLAPITTHDLRRGALRDTAYRTTQSTSGLADNFVALAAGHTDKALSNGVTQHYVGDLQTPLWNDRASNTFVDHKAPAFAPSPAPDMTTRTKAGKADVRAYMEKHGLDTSSESARRHATRAWRNEAMDAWRTGEGFEVEPTPSKKQKVEVLREQSASEINVRSNRPVPSDSFVDAGTRLPSHSVHAPAGDERSNLDPALFGYDDENEETEVDSNELDHVCNLVTQTVGDEAELDDSPDDIDDETFEQTVATELAPASDTVQLTGNAFVQKFAAINVFRTTSRFNIDNPTALAKRVSSGNSRDPPSPYIFRCKQPNCPYSTRLHQDFERHTGLCTGFSAPPKKEFPCPYDDCDKAYSSEMSLKTHLDEHRFTPRPCPRCPDKPDVLYRTRAELNAHGQKVHTALPTAALCPLQKDCGSKKLWDNRTNLKKHLRELHRLQGKDADAYLPKVGNGKGFTCTVLSCRQEFSKITQLRLHMREEHQLSAKEALAKAPGQRKPKSRVTVEEPVRGERSVEPAELAQVGGDEGSADEDDAGDEGDVSEEEAQVSPYFFQQYYYQGQ
ncbi:uncharacterized protein LTR77_004271 [Saxophila tyrrhenica]|uniref:C2H2-type domain-containing protein n=1 Tax=Saxophila tyrrhenica TaxID=1690608 RepID=A0AAV9PF79_9PEZI|nr:hypothetical protein LTR77_004271 [Saxophila tyrrhenica]